MTVEGQRIVIAPTRPPREGWEETFRIVAGDDDELPIEDNIENSWDAEEWRW